MAAGHHTADPNPRPEVVASSFWVLDEGRDVLKLVAFPAPPDFNFDVA